MVTKDMPVQDFSFRMRGVGMTPMYVASVKTFGFSHVPHTLDVQAVGFMSGCMCETQEYDGLSSYRVLLVET
jgi:hypothetical protein